MIRLLLIRHASTDSVGKRLSGRTRNIHLNHDGRDQARKLAERLRKLKLSAIYSSPMERAQETAEPISALFKIPTVISEDFQEIDFGRWTNHSFGELENDPRFKLFNSFRSATRIPGGELMTEAQLRMIRGLEKVADLHRNETVAVISHADMIRAALAYYLGIPLDLFQRIEISPASVSVVELYEETVRITRLNDTGELNFH